LYSQNDNAGCSLSNCSNWYVDVHADGAFVVHSAVTACVVAPPSGPSSTASATSFSKDQSKQ